MHSTLFSSIWFWWEALFCQGLSQLNKVEAKATRKSPWTFGGPRKAWVVISWSRASLSSLPLDIRGRRGWTCNDDKGFLLNLTVSILSMGWKTYNFQEKNQYLPKLQLKLPYDLVIVRSCSIHTQICLYKMKIIYIIYISLWPVVITNIVKLSRSVVFNSLRSHRQ